MAKVINFPNAADRNWLVWEQSIRAYCNEAAIPSDITNHAMPRVREHWSAIFEPIDLELPKRPVPGKLTEKQAETIQSIINDAALLVVERLQRERISSFQRLLDAELELSMHLVGAKPSLT